MECGYRPCVGRTRQTGQERSTLLRKNAVGNPPYSPHRESGLQPSVPAFEDDTFHPALHQGAEDPRAFHRRGGNGAGAQDRPEQDRYRPGSLPRAERLRHRRQDHACLPLARLRAGVRRAAPRLNLKI